MELRERESETGSVMSEASADRCFAAYAEDYNGSMRKINKVGSDF